VSGHVTYALVTAPTEEPLSLADAKRHAHVDHDFEDGLFQSWIKTARQQVEQDTELKLLTQTWQQLRDDFPYDEAPITIDAGPVQSVTFLKYYDFAGVLQTHAPSNYTVDVTSRPARLDQSDLDS
jgi:uncharacterized phiE125 gp8 family phage protein